MFRRIRLIIFLALLLASSGCLMGGFPFKREIRDGKSISNFTLDGDYVYFGAGYHLYRLNLSNRVLETLLTTDRILVEQPVVSDGVAYFGGRTLADQKGNYGETQGFFALNLQNREIIWKFPLGVDGYGTYGTYPALAGDRILVCAREHLHCLDRKSGKELWRVDNWMGGVSDGVVRPYAYDGSAYFMIAEEHVADSQKGDENDGHWAEVPIDTGQRFLIPIAGRPGTWEDSDGTGHGALVDGVIYGATRINRFGALDLKAKKIAWEVQGINLARPAVDDKHVFTARENSIQALDRKTGSVIWSVPLGEIAKTDIDRSQERIEWDYENYWSRRFAVTGEVLVAQGSQGVATLRAKDGRLLWLTKSESDYGIADPLIWRNMVIASSQKDCSIFALDLKTGKELWRVRTPDCRYYYIFDD